MNKWRLITRNPETAIGGSRHGNKLIFQRKSSGVSQIFAMLPVCFAFCACTATASAAEFAAAEPSEPIPLMAPINPAFEKRQMHPKAQPMSEGENKGYRPSPVDRSHMTGLTPSMNSFTGAYPASFDLRSSGYVSNVKDQGKCNDCWAFATLSSLESNMLKGGGGANDFSENHMNVRHGFDGGACSDGNGDMAGAYMTRWGGASYAAGPVYETDDPYTQNALNGTPPYDSVAGLSPRAHLQEFLVLPDRGSGTDNNNYKYALQNYGAMSVAFHIDNGIVNGATSAYWNQATSSYYYNSSADTNHLVDLVGWDDNYAAGNFSTRPPGSGAFIAKNQWGTSFGDNGYFYISYYDWVLSDAHVFLTPESTANYARAYLYDPFGQTSSWGYSSYTAWGANVFTATADEILQAVAFYTLQVDSSYEVSIYTGVSSTPTSGSLEGGTVNTAGSFPYAGYHTVKLARPVPLAAEQKFAVVVKFTTPGYTFPIPLEAPFSAFDSAASAGAAQSYISGNGVTWGDMTKYNANTNINIRAYTAAQAGVSPPVTTSADCLFNWAEKTYPQYLSPAQATSNTWGVFYYRYYPGSNNYLGVASDTRHVTLLSAGIFQDLGDISTWLGTAGCQ